MTRIPLDCHLFYFLINSDFFAASFVDDEAKLFVSNQAF